MGGLREEELLVILHSRNSAAKVGEPGLQMGPESRGVPLTWRLVGEVQGDSGVGER